MSKPSILNKRVVALSNHVRLLLLLLTIFTTCYSFAQNVTYQTLYTSATFDGRAINQSLPVGSIPGAGSAASGAATYSIAIETPPRTNAVGPAVSINYHSIAGNGVLGQGWEVGGLSKITRSMRDMYFDNETNPVVMTNADRFVVDGTRLIAKVGNYGDPIPLTERKTRILPRRSPRVPRETFPNGLK